MYKSKLLEIGIPAHLNGFEYLNTILELYEPLTKLTWLYVTTAKRYNVTPNTVVKAISFALRFVPEKLSAGEFIAKYKTLWECDSKGGGRIETGAVIWH